MESLGLNKRFLLKLKKGISSILVLAFGLSIACQDAAFALPSGYQVESGDVSFDTSLENTLVINASENAIINFDSFSIAENEVVRFVQPSEVSSVLSRVTGFSSSNIFGNLFANGELLLINPNGIYFAPTANVEVGSLIASTLDIQNAMYLAGDRTFEKMVGSPFASIVNEGNISVAEGGHLALLAETVLNSGTLEAYLGDIVLGAGEKVTLSFDAGQRINLVIDRGIANELISSPLVENSGAIQSLGGKTTISAHALEVTLDTLIMNTGIVEASAVFNQNGQIEFVSNGAIVNTETGVIRTNEFREWGYTYRSSGTMDGGIDEWGNVIAGNAYYDNLDGAANISGNIGTNQTDVGDLVVTGDITLTADNLVFTADSDANGSGAFTMGDFTINGATFNLTISATESSVLDRIDNVGTLRLSLSDSDADNAIFVTADNLTSLGGLTIDDTVQLWMDSNTLAFDASTQLNMPGVGLLILNGDETLTNVQLDSDSGGVVYFGAGTYNSLVAGNSYVLLGLYNGTYNLNSTLNVTYNFVLGTDATVNFGDENVNAGWFEVDFADGATFDSGTSTLTLTADGVTESMSGGTFYNLVLDGAGSEFTMTQDAVVTNALTLTDGEFSGGTIEARGAVTHGSNFDGGTGTLRIAGGSGARTINLAADGFLPNLVINDALASVVSPDDVGDITFASIQLDAGTLTGGQYTTMAVTGNFVQNGGTFNMPEFNTTTTSGSLAVEGNFTYTAGTLNYNNITDLLIFVGGGGQTFTTGGIDYASFAVNKLGGDAIISGALDIEGDLLLLDGGLDLDTNDPNVTIARNLFWDSANGATVTRGSGSITMDGSSSRTISLDGQNIGALIISAGAGTTTMDQVDLFDLGLFVASGDSAFTTLTLNSALTSNGSLTATTLTANAGAYAVILNGASNTVTNAVTFSNTGGVTFGDGGGDVSLFNGGVVSTASTTTVTGALRTSGDTLTLGAVTLGGDATIDATNNGGTATGGALTLGAVTGTSDALTISSGTDGDTTIASLTGITTFTVTQSDDTTISGTTSATTVTLTDTDNIITFGGSVTAATLNTAIQGYSVVFNDGGTLTNDVTFLNTGGVTFGNNIADVILFNGGLDTTAGATTAIGSVRTSGDRTDIGALTLSGNATFDTTNNGGTAAGAILNIGAVTGGANALTLNSGTNGTIALTSVTNGGAFTMTNNSSATISGNIGVTSFTHTAGSTTMQGAANTASGNLVVNGGTLNIGAGDFTVSGDTTIGANAILQLDDSTTNGLVTRDLTIAVDGTLFIGELDNGRFSISGDWTQLGTFDWSSNSGLTPIITFTGATDQTIDVSGDGANLPHTTHTGAGDLIFVSDVQFFGNITNEVGAGDMDMSGIDNVAFYWSIFMNDGEILGGTSAWNYGGSGNNNITSNGSVFNEFRINTNGGTITLDDAFVVTTDFTIDDGDFDTNSQVMTVGGDFTNNDAFDATGSNVTFNGSGAQTITSGALATTTWNQVTVNGRAAGTVAFVGSHTLPTFSHNTTGGAGYGISFGGGTSSITNDVTFLNTGGVTLGTGTSDIILFNGGLDTTAGAAIAQGTIRTSADQIDIAALTISGTATIDTTNNNTSNGASVSVNGAVILNGGLTIDVDRSASASDGGITFGSTINGGQALTLEAGSGSIDLNGIVGGSTRLGAITISSVSNFSADLAITAASITQSAGSGTTTFNGALNTNAIGGVQLTGTDLMVSSNITTTNSGVVTLNASGNITLQGDSTLSLDGAFTETGNISLGSHITTTNDNIIFNGDVSVTGNRNLNTGAGAGNITFNNAVDGGGGSPSFVLTAGTGDITFTDDVTGIGDFTINSADDIAAGNVSANSYTQNGGEATFTGDVILTSSATIDSSAIVNMDDSWTVGDNFTISGDGHALGGIGNIIDINGDLIIEESGYFESVNSDIRVAGDWNNTSDNELIADKLGFDGGDSTVTFDGVGTRSIITNDAPFNLVNFDGTATWNLDGGFLAIDEDLNLEQGTLNANGESIIIAGNWNNTNSVFNAGTGLVMLVGTTDQVITPRGQEFYNLNINNTGIGGSDDVTVVGSLTVDASFTLTDGNFHAPGAAQTFTVAADFLVTGGTFTHNSGTVTLNSATEATLDAPVGGLNFWDLEIVTAGKTVNFTAGDTFVVESPNTWTVTGTAPSPIILQSTTPGQQWNIDLQADGWDLSNVEVSDSNNLNFNTVGYIEEGGTILNLQDGGGTTGWFRSSTPPPPDDPILPDPPEECLLCDQQNPGIRSALDISMAGYDPCLDSAFETKKGEDPCKSQKPVNRPKKKDDVSTYVEVTEGIVAVDDYLIYDGENIQVDSDKQAMLNKRSVYVTLADGILVLRAKIHEKVKEIKLHETPAGIVAAQKNKDLYVVFPKTGKLSTISDINQKGTQNIFGLSHQSTEVILSYDEKYAYVLSSGEDQIQKVNLEKGKVEKVFKTGSFPSKAVLTQDGRYLYVTQYLDGTVSRIDAQTGKVDVTKTAGKAPYGIALSTDGKRLYVTDLLANQILVYSLPEFNSLPSILLKDHSPWVLEAGKEGKYLYVTSKQNNTLSRVELATGAIQDYKVGKNPGDFELTPEGNKAYVVNQLSGSISLVNFENGSVEEISVGTAPSHLAISTPTLKQRPNRLIV